MFIFFSFLQLPSDANHNKELERQSTGGINLLQLADQLGIPESTFTVIFFATAVIGLYLAFIYGSVAAWGLVMYFGISAVSGVTDEYFGDVFFSGDISDKSGDGDDSSMFLKLPIESVKN